MTPEQISALFMQYTGAQFDAAKASVVNANNQALLTQMIYNVTLPPPVEPPPTLPSRTVTQYTGAGIVITGGGGQGGLDQLIENKELYYIGAFGQSGNDGVSVTGPRPHVTLRNLILDRFTFNAIIQGNEGLIGELLLEDCVIKNGAMGLYASRCSKITLRRCILSDNGTPDIFSHNAYLQQDCGPLDARECVFVRGGSHGMQVRSGGVVEDCLFYENPISLSFGGGTEFVPGGVDAVARRNVFIRGRDITPTLPRGWGIHLSNIKSGEISGNAFLDNIGGDSGPIILDPAAIDQHGTSSVGVLNVTTVAPNVSRGWPKVRSAGNGGPPFVSLDTLAPLTGTNIVVSGSTSTASPYTAQLTALLSPTLPRPSVASYNASVRALLGMA